MDFLKNFWSPTNAQQSRSSQRGDFGASSEVQNFSAEAGGGLNNRFSGSSGVTVSPGPSPRLRPRLPSRGAPPPRYRNLSGSACGMTYEELEEHVGALGVSRHTFQGHLAHILRKLMDHAENRGVFNKPVKIPGYHKVVGQPMDLQSVRAKLISGAYSSVQDFSADVTLVFDNAILYNPVNHPIHRSATILKSLVSSFIFSSLEKMEMEAKNPMLQVLPSRSQQKSSKKTGKSGGKSKGSARPRGPEVSRSKPGNAFAPDALKHQWSAAGGERQRAESTRPSNARSTSSLPIDFGNRQYTCALCKSGDLVLSIPVLRCGAPCNAKIQRGARYFIASKASSEGLAQHWCNKCYNALPVEFNALYGEVMKKSDLIQCTNDEVFLEKWIQCGNRKIVTGPAGERRCTRVMHMACALYMPTTLIPLRPPYVGLGWTANNPKNEPRVDCDKRFKCPNCFLSDGENQWETFALDAPKFNRNVCKTHSKGEGKIANAPVSPSNVNSWHVAYSPSHDYSAAALPESSLSKRIERRLRRRIFSEAIKGDSIGREIAADFLSGVKVRALAGEFRDLNRWPRLKRWVTAQRKVYAARAAVKFPYRPVAVFLFQRIAGTDVCLFAMYVHEYGVDGNSPNSKKSYISYLDSTNYMQPSIFRTPTYHEIMLGYLEDAKQRGYESVYIWACPPPPRAGDSYILNCHPKYQRTPNTERLVKWYKTIEAKAIEEGLVVHSEDITAAHFYGHRAFRQTRGSAHSSRRKTGGNSKASAADKSNTVQSAPEWGKAGCPSNLADLPYFTGDFWLSEAESILRELEGFSEMVDDPDEGMRLWWQELTRQNFQGGASKKDKRKRDNSSAGGSKAYPTVAGKKKSKFSRILSANIPETPKNEVGTKRKSVKVKVKMMQTDIRLILQRREGERARWLETVRKSKLPTPKKPPPVPTARERESWIMSRLAARISPMKEHHLVWHLKHKCFGCLRYISDNEVRYLYDSIPPVSKESQTLCSECHSKPLDKGKLFMFRFNKVRKRKGINFTVKKIVPEADNAKKGSAQNSYGTFLPTVSRNSIFDTRMALLAYLQRMSFQFDQLRRAKHSSMMILYHMHTAMGKSGKKSAPDQGGLSLSDQVYQ
jgi:hypothetical protein